MNHFYYESEDGALLSVTGEETAAEAAVAATEDGKMPVADAGLTAVLGYTVVFSGLLMLLAIVAVTGAIFKGLAKKKAAKAAAAVPETPAAPAAEAKTAPGSAGEVKCFDVPDKEAAMIMAIVADKLQKPLNELRFISIREVK